MQGEHMGQAINGNAIIYRPIKPPIVEMRSRSRMPVSNAGESEEYVGTDVPGKRYWV